MLNRKQKRRVRDLAAKLKSSEFRQLKGGLYRGDELRCCLGVACEVYMEQEGGEFLGHGLFRNAEGEIERPEMALPKSVQEWFGFDSPNPNIGRSNCTVATEANDMLGWSFEKIADAFTAKYCSSKK